MRRLPAHMLGPRADRPPVSGYEDALWWLINHYRWVSEPLSADKSLPDAAVLVCDIFWVTERTLRADISKVLGQVLPDRRPLRWRDRSA